MKAFRRPFSFAVVSDTHFVRREFGSTSERETNQLDPDAYVENVTYALAPMMDTLRELDPDLLFITGDIVEPSVDSHAAEDLKAALAFFSTCEIPIVYARGNLDDAQAFEVVVRPQVALALDIEIEQNYFSFSSDECLFVILDTSAWSQQQCLWVEQTLEDARRSNVEHVFIFGHHPVWPVARAFFLPFAFSQDMARLLQEFDVDGYFCGHTHNQSMIWHRTQGLPVFQFMGAMIGVSDEPPLALDQVLEFLPTQDDLLAHWPGYLENTAPGWFMVSVKSHEVVAEWHHLNRGAEAVVAWDKPGNLLDFWMMDQVSPSKLISTDLGRFRRGFLRFCAWDGAPDMQVSLNGSLIGHLPVRDGFAPTRLELPEQILRTLQMENRLVITPPAGCKCTLGNLMLEVMLPGGRYIRTPTTRDLFSWTDKWSSWSYKHLKQLAPDGALQTMLIFE
ncbi:MAG: hypothetical protein HOE48_01305 [Candidatus Latescibacteria bacterium]|nr:hypothetical protein [Candidatus Latescibacterota bacterium]MBT4136514.1 hypothetical protein [Candidatus Latescibacterota bacterium]